MNYLQVTGTALRLQTDWNPLLKGLLTFESEPSSFDSDRCMVGILLL